MKFCSLYLTFPDEPQARRVIQSLLEKRLIACANILPGAISIYRWDDAVQESAEYVVIAKARSADFEEIRSEVRAQHSYDCPCIVAWPLKKIDADYRAWLKQATRRSPRSPDNDPIPESPGE